MKYKGIFIAVMVLCGCAEDKKPHQDMFDAVIDIFTESYFEKPKSKITDTELQKLAGCANKIDKIAYRHCSNEFKTAKGRVELFFDFLSDKFKGDVLRCKLNWLDAQFLHDEFKRFLTSEGYIE